MPGYDQQNFILKLIIGKKKKKNYIPLFSVEITSRKNENIVALITKHKTKIQISRKKARLNSERRFSITFNRNQEIIPRLVTTHGNRCRQLAGPKVTTDGSTERGAAYSILYFPCSQVLRDIFP
jgi:hypothetical protein